MEAFHDLLERHRGVMHRGEREQGVAQEGQLGEGVDFVGA